MRPLALLLPVPGMCCVLLLWGVLSAQHTDWDSHQCTDTVTVTQGQPAVMTCNLSDAYTRVYVKKIVPGGEPHLLFNVTPPSSVSNAGWQLLVQGSVARLLVAEAQLGQAGTYLWGLKGKQWTLKNTILNVTEPQETVVTSAGGTAVASFVGVDRQQSGVPWSVALVILSILGLVCAVKCRRSRYPGAWRLQCPPTMLTEDLQGQESDHVQLAPGLQP